MIQKDEIIKEKRVDGDEDFLGEEEDSSVGMTGMQWNEKKRKEKR